MFKSMCLFPWQPHLIPPTCKSQSSSFYVLLYGFLNTILVMAYHSALSVAIKWVPMATKTNDLAPIDIGPHICTQKFAY